MKLEKRNLIYRPRRLRKSESIRKLVRETHPDRVIARGVPEEAVRMAERRMIAINRAYEEIADITGLPMGTVKSRINRGRTKLQGILKDVYVPAED